MMRKVPPLNVAQIGYGCMGLSHAYSHQPDEAGGIALIRDAIELGVDHIDTAILYGFGSNEVLVGKALQGRRDQVLLASKCGLTITDAHGGMTRGIDSTPGNIKRSCDGSLKRLGFDSVDLYYLHRWDKTTPIEDVVGAMAQLVDEGKTRLIGLSEVSAATLRKAHAVHPIAAIQCEYSLWTRNPEENGILDACQELGIALVCYSPVGRGFLANATVDTNTLEADDLRRNMPRFAPENLAKNQALRDEFLNIAEGLGCTPSQLALAWLLNRPVYTIPGTTSPTHLRENLAAIDVELPSDVIERLDSLFNSSTVSGNRYNEKTMAELE